MSRVFVDTGAFIGLLSKGDQLAPDAIRIYDELNRGSVTLLTTNHIIAETCNWLLRNRDAGFRAALQFHEFLASTSSPVDMGNVPRQAGIRDPLLVVYVNPAVEAEAWRMLRRYDTAGFSFTDCVSFAVMQSLDIKKAFTFDKHYDMLGFERL